MIDYSLIPSPCYVLDEQLFRRNLSLLRSVKERADVEIILAFKAFALWKVFPILHEYGFCVSTASSLAEVRLAMEGMGDKAHTYAPVYQTNEFAEIAACSSHITFNSLSQFARFHSQISNFKFQISCGLRINPEVSVVETDLYNPAKAGSRLGVAVENLSETLPQGIEGLHFHVLCESSASDLEKVLNVVEQKFSKYFSQIKWLNFGGGHLITHKNYEVEKLIDILTKFKTKYPHLQIILEPGAAFVWQTGVLFATVQDIVENQGIKTAMLDISFACHLPDCLEMPYQPEILYQIKDERRKTKDFVRAKKNDNSHFSLLTSHFYYRLGGNSCLSGDYLGDWHFERELKIGDKIVFEDMIHYTTVKTTMFNGVTHPSIGIWTQNSEFQLLKEFSYEDYKNRMC